MESAFNWRSVCKGMALSRGTAQRRQGSPHAEVQTVAATTFIATIGTDGEMVVRCANPDVASASPAALLSPWRLAQTLATQYLARPGGVLGDEVLLSHVEAGLRTAVGFVSASELPPCRGIAAEHLAGHSRRVI